MLDMPKPVKKSVMIIAMAAALCAVVAIAFRWRPLMATWFYMALRDDTARARAMLVTELDGWRMDGLELYINTEDGARLLCEELFGEIQRAEPMKPMEVGLLYAGLSDSGALRTLHLTPGVAKFFAEVAPRDQLRSLCRHAARLAEERVVPLTAQGVVVTLNAHSDPMIPESMRDDMRRWHVVQIRMAVPGRDFSLEFDHAKIARGFAAFKRAMEGNP